MDVDKVDAMGYLAADTPSGPLLELAAVAKCLAEQYPPGSREFRSWTALAGRYEYAARKADKNARETHGFAGDDT